MGKLQEPIAETAGASACGCGCGCSGHTPTHEHGHGEHTQEHSHEADACGCGCGHAHGEQEDGRAIPRLIAAAVLFLLSLIPALHAWGSLLLCGAATVVAAYPVAIGMWNEWKRHTIGEQTLLAIAVAAAFVIGEGREGAMVAILFGLGGLLEGRAVGRSRREIEKLSSIRPDVAWRMLPGGETEQIDAGVVQVGDLLLVPPHQRVPVDCTVVSGESELDMSALTGESEPVTAAAGTALLSGSMNGSGTLTVRADNRAETSAAARILQLVTDSAARKGQSEKFITRFARVYTPVVVVLALLLATLPPLLFADGWTDWIGRALVFLVASCPCALVISVPLGFTAGMGAASRIGVLIKGGKYVEALAGTQAVAMDKTGTLTTGQSAVSRVVTAEGVTEREALILAASLEKTSEHPLSAAVLAYAKEHGHEADLPLEKVQELPAKGMAAEWEGQVVLCGGRRLLDAYGVDAADWPEAPLYVAQDGRVIAALELQSVVRDDARETVRSLRQLGVTRVAMLTGDGLRQAQEVAERTGITEVHAGLLPEDKLDTMQTIQQENGHTLFVGDGINDAPVLAQADAGVAMGLGSAAAIVAGDVVLMAGKLSQLPRAIRLCRRAMNTVRFNIAFALLVKAVVLVLAALGWAPMWAAVFADVGVSCLCVLNSSRLLLTKR